MPFGRQNAAIVLSKYFISGLQPDIAAKADSGRRKRAAKLTAAALYDRTSRAGSLRCRNIPALLKCSLGLSCRPAVYERLYAVEMEGGIFVSGKFRPAESFCRRSRRGRCSRTPPEAV